MEVWEYMLNSPTRFLRVEAPEGLVYKLYRQTFTSQSLEILITMRNFPKFQSLFMNLEKVESSIEHDFSSKFIEF